MHRQTAKDFPQELLDLYDEYVHGQVGRRGFLDRAAKFAVGGGYHPALRRAAKLAWERTVAFFKKELGAS